MLGGMSAPPDGLPVYRVLTGRDDAAFCRRVSEAIEMGYRLHGGPALTCNGGQVVVAQALLWPGAGIAPVDLTEQTERLAYSIGEFAEAIGVSRDLVNDMLKSGQVKRIKAGGRVLIPVTEVEKFMNSA